MTSEMVEGQSLIAAAQSNKNSYTDSSMERSEANSDMLQATLMGDYGGMVSCSDCDSIDVTLNLFADGSVLKASNYHNSKESKHPYSNPVSTDRTMTKLLLFMKEEVSKTYHIQDNHLIRMDEYDNLDNDYTLSRK